MSCGATDAISRRVRASDSPGAVLQLRLYMSYANECGTRLRDYGFTRPLVAQPYASDSPAVGPTARHLMVQGMFELIVAT